MSEVAASPVSPRRNRRQGAVFGQVVTGPPGAGKSTYAHGMYQVSDQDMKSSGSLARDPDEAEASMALGDSDELDISSPFRMGGTDEGDSSPLRGKEGSRTALGKGSPLKPSGRRGSDEELGTDSEVFNIARRSLSGRTFDVPF